MLVSKKSCIFAAQNADNVKIKDVIATLEVFAPLPLQDGYDNAGLQVGEPEAEVSGVLLCLDVTEAVLAEAVAKGCNMVVAHHPLLFHPLRQVGDVGYVERCVRYAIKNDITVYAAHTNLDNVRGGVSFALAVCLGMQDVEILKENGNGGGWVVASEYAYKGSYSDAYYPLQSRGEEFMTEIVKPRFANVNRVGVWISHDMLVVPLTAYGTNKKVNLRYFDTKQWINYLAGVAIILGTDGTLRYVPVKGLSSGTMTM